MLDRLMRYATLALKLPPKVFVAKIAHRLKSNAMAVGLRQRDRWRSTYDLLPPYFAGAMLAQRCSPVIGFVGKQQIDEIRVISRHYLEHRFDLLGSGWVEVSHGMVCAGLEGHRYPPAHAVLGEIPGRWSDNCINPSNLIRAKSIAALLTPGYVPIDWQLDFKSGYRWDEKTWYQDIQFGHFPGVDVKVPWELSRMQHLPQLAHAYALATYGTEGFAPPDYYLREFRDQILDFVASNPPRYGVNWACTMDVGIRIANWLMAHDLFMCSGAKFDDEFEQVLLQSVYQHGLHIINNLEWHAELRSNHYLADIVGLLFVAAYLPCFAETDAWLAFAIQELVVEVQSQFHQEGGNFEASTCYHRLSAELVVYGTAIVAGLPESKRKALARFNHNLIRGVPRLRPAPLDLYPIPGTDTLGFFPPWFWEKLEKMAEFTWHITRPDLLVPQIGDNDSGRLFKLQPVYETLTVRAAKARYQNLGDYADLAGDEIYLREESQDHRHLVAAINGFFARSDFADFSEGFELEAQLIRALAKVNDVPNISTGPFKPRVENVCITEAVPDVEELQQRKYEFVLPKSTGTNLIDGLRLHTYPEFGVYLYKSSQLYLAIRCGDIGLNGLGAHAHNDPLSIELWINSQPIIIDGGSYVYTPLPARRNEFRSVSAHFSPHIEGREPGNLQLNVFQLGDEAKARCLSFNRREFIGYYLLGESRIYRKITVETDIIKLVDWVVGEARPLVKLDPSHLPCSAGYGWRINNTEVGAT